MQKSVIIGGNDVNPATFCNDSSFSLICGPCQLESLEHSLKTAEFLQKTCEKLGIGLVFKGSFDKANRTSHNGQRGVGLEKGLEVFSQVRRQLGIPVITDIHDETQIEAVAEVVDCLQIPAFLCRQTDLLLKAGQTGKPVNVKKGQFLAPWDMQNVVAKVASTDNENILLTERGSSFGYGNLVVDMRGMHEMKKTNYPVIFDATHSVQMPGGNGTSSGGKREYVEPLARAAASLAIGGFFLEAHETPDNAPSDGPNMVPLDKIKGLLITLKNIDEIAKEQQYQNIKSSS